MNSRENVIPQLAIPELPNPNTCIALAPRNGELIVPLMQIWVPWTESPLAGQNTDLDNFKIVQNAKNLAKCIDKKLEAGDFDRLLVHNQSLNLVYIRLIIDILLFGGDTY